MGNRIRVLLADDHDVVRRGIRQFLEEAGDLAVEPTAAHGGDGRGLVPIIKTVEQQHGVIVERAIGAGGVGTVVDGARSLLRHEWRPPPPC